MVLLAVVTVFSAAIAGGATLLKSAPAADKKAIYLANRTLARGEPVAAAEQTPVRVIGAPFVPNTNPRER
jgi:hypothetical protein